MNFMLEARVRKFLGQRLRITLPSQKGIGTPSGSRIRGSYAPTHLKRGASFFGPRRPQAVVPQTSATNVAKSKSNAISQCRSSTKSTRRTPVSTLDTSLWGILVRLASSACVRPRAVSEFLQQLENQPTFPAVDCLLHGPLPCDPEAEFEHRICGNRIVDLTRRSVSQYRPVHDCPLVKWPRAGFSLVPSFAGSEIHEHRRCFFASIFSRREPQEARYASDQRRVATSKETDAQTDLG